MVKSFFFSDSTLLAKSLLGESCVFGILAELSPNQNQKLGLCLFHVTEVGFFIICPSRVPWMPWMTLSFMKA